MKLNIIHLESEYAKKRARLEEAIKSNNPGEVESALLDFEALLETDEMKQAESELLQKAKALLEGANKSSSKLNLNFG